MKIGLDFDGVIADQLAIKALVTKELFGKSVPLTELKKEILEKTKTITLNQYEQVKQAVYDEEQNMERTPEIPGAVAGIRQLLGDGHELRIITSRYGRSVELAETWLKARALEIPVISVGYGVSKHSAMIGEQLFVDDDLPKLEQLFETVPNLVLFECYPVSTPAKLDPRITSIDSWTKLLAHIASLDIDTA